MSSLDKLEQELNLVPTDYNIFCNSLTQEKQESMEHYCSIEPEQTTCKQEDNKTSRLYNVPKRETLSPEEIEFIVDFYGEQSGIRKFIDNLQSAYHWANDTQQIKMQQLFEALIRCMPVNYINLLNKQLMELYEENQ